MIQSKTQKIIKDTNGNEVVMIRIDKTLKDLMEGKPSSRWDVDFWHPNYDDLFLTIRKFKTVLLDDHRDEIKSGFRSGGVKFTERGFPYIQVRNVLETGLDLFNTDNIGVDSGARQSNKKLAYGDILLNRSGQGSVGRLTVFLGNEEAYVGGHVYRFSVKKLSPVYVTVFLKTKYGKEQIHRFESGVSGQTELDLEEILHIEIPLLEIGVVKNIENEYALMSKSHDQAMKSKKAGNEAEYKKHIEKADKQLKDLIARTEAVIRGERDDVI